MLASQGGREQLSVVTWGTSCMGLAGEGASKCSLEYKLTIKLLSFLELGLCESSGSLKWHRAHKGGERRDMGVEFSRRRYMGGIWNKSLLC